MGETFPVGCRFHPAIRHSQFFSANPDRRKRLYSSPTGVYRDGCGLGGVLMSWGAGEYLHLVLRLNRVALPAEALFCLRWVPVPLPLLRCAAVRLGWAWAGRVQGRVRHGLRAVGSVCLWQCSRHRPHPAPASGFRLTLAPASLPSAAPRSCSPLLLLQAPEAAVRLPPGRPLQRASERV